MTILEITRADAPHTTLHLVAPEYRLGQCEDDFADFLEEE